MSVSFLVYHNEIHAAHRPDINARVLMAKFSYEVVLKNVLLLLGQLIQCFHNKKVLARSTLGECEGEKVRVVVYRVGGVVACFVP